MSQDWLPTPDPAESAMLGVITEDMLAEASKTGQAECWFRQYHVLVRQRSPTRRRLVIDGHDGTLIDADIDTP